LDNDIDVALMAVWQLLPELPVIMFANNLENIYI